ncbi:MAG TPA: helix-turn-helix domain-containing protein [Pyrinomonadaceae bacterium]
MKESLMSERQAAKALGISRTTLRKYHAKGFFNPVRKGNRVLYLAFELNDFDKSEARKRKSA